MYWSRSNPAADRADHQIEVLQVSDTMFLFEQSNPKLYDKVRQRIGFECSYPLLHISS